MTETVYFASVLIGDEEIILRNVSYSKLPDLIPDLNYVTTTSVAELRATAASEINDDIPFIAVFVVNSEGYVTTCSQTYNGTCDIPSVFDSVHEFEGPGVLFVLGYK